MIGMESYKPRRQTCCDYVYKVARSGPELEAFFALRRSVFCKEQRVFRRTDVDRYDEGMIPIICSSLVMGMEDRIVGAVRIDERSPGVWWGSRLCVHRAFRRVTRISPGVAQRNGHPSFWANRSIGAGLIFKAVSTAARIGCTAFLAEVQDRNVPFFERLHWRSLESVSRHGLPHTKMKADLAFYPPEDVPADRDLELIAS